MGDPLQSFFISSISDYKQLWLSMDLSQVSDTGSLEPLVSSPDSKGHVSFSNHESSVVCRLLTFHSLMIKNSAKQ